MLDEIGLREIRSMQFQEWHESEDRRLLRLLAEDYHERCDGFDNLHLTGPMGRDGRLPRDSRELGMCGEHAAAVKRELQEKAWGMGFSALEFHEAIAESGRRRRR